MTLGTLQAQNFHEKLQLEERKALSQVLAEELLQGYIVGYIEQPPKKTFDELWETTIIPNKTYSVETLISTIDRFILHDRTLTKTYIELYLPDGLFIQGKYKHNRRFTFIVTPQKIKVLT